MTTRQLRFSFDRTAGDKVMPQKQRVLMPTSTCAVIVLLLALWTDFSFGAQLSVQTYTVATVAGNGQSGFGEDGGAAVSAELNSPGSIAADNKGNLYIADLQNARIRKVSIDGKITTVAGNGQRGFSGDGGLAINASLDMAFNPVNAAPYFVYDGGLALDAAGRLYFADSNNHRIRKIDLNGVITTVAGTGDFGYAGDGGPAVLAILSFPSNLAIDRTGNIYIADTGNRVIRKVSPDGTITTVASGKDLRRDGWVGFKSPTGVAVNEDGELYVADPVFYYFGDVFKVDREGNVRSISSPRLGGDIWTGPSSVAVDPMGNILVADTYNNVVEWISRDEQRLTTFSVPTLATPRGVSVDSSGTIYIADTGNQVVRMIAPPGPKLTLNSTKYCLESGWTMGVESVLSDTSIDLIGISNGTSWEVPSWRRTTNTGNFFEAGTFGSGTEGEHAIRVRIANMLSNTVSFTVSGCAP
jgi:sugar lactone lactonase YvrE